MGQADLVSVNNPVKADFTDVTNPTNSLVINFTYSYNSNNKPVTGTQTQTPGGSTKNLSFFYQ
jgi:hypothetical protein